MSKRKKKQKTLEELLEEALVPKEDQPYEVPENWIWVRLGSLTEVVGGGTPKTSVAEYYNNGTIPWITPADLSGFKDMFIERGKRNITKLGLEKSSARMIPANSVLLSSRAPIGYVAIAANSLSTNQGFKSFLPSKAILPKFLFWYLKNSKAYLESMASGSTFKEISATRCKQLSFPLAPLNEQKRIADKVERLLNKIDQAKQLIEEAKETFELRRAAILDKAFRGELTAKWREENPEVESAEVLLEKIKEERKDSKRQKRLAAQKEKSNGHYSLPSSWKWVRLSEILEVNPPKEKVDVPDDQICSFVPMASVCDVTGKIVKIEERSFSDVKRGYTFFKDRDIIFAKITPCMENGKSAIVKGMKNGFGYGSTEFYVLRTSKYINEQLVHLLVRSKKFRIEAKRVMTGAVGQQRVPKQFIEDYNFPLPSREEQDKIVSLLNSFFKKEEEIMQITYLVKALDKLKQSILSKAFRGELGTNDPTEESAIELLKQVLQEQQE